MNMNIVEIAVKHAINLFNEISEIRRAKQEEVQIISKMPPPYAMQESNFRERLMDTFIIQQTCEFAKTMENHEAYKKAIELFDILESHLIKNPD